MPIDGHTRLFGIIGNPVTHSLSPAMHNAALAALGINGVYVPMQPASGAEAVQALRVLGFAGASVTVPFKKEVMAVLDEIDPVADRIGAVNTLLFYTHPGEDTVRVRGFNTDWLGSNLALARHLELMNSRVLVLGAGGAARGVCFGLVEAGAEVLISNRSEDRGRKLAEWLGCRFVPRDRLAGIRADVLVNTTSVGMTPHDDGIPIDPDLLSGFSVVMDIVYAPLRTRLLTEAEKRGCVTIDGLEMLLGQAAVQLKIWTGLRPDQGVMRQALEQALEEQRKERERGERS